MSAAAVMASPQEARFLIRAIGLRDEDEVQVNQGGDVGGVPLPVHLLFCFVLFIWPVEKKKHGIRRSISQPLQKSHQLILYSTNRPQFLFSLFQKDQYFSILMLIKNSVEFDHKKSYEKWGGLYSPRTENLFLFRPRDQQESPPESSTPPFPFPTGTQRPYNDVLYCSTVSNKQKNFRFPQKGTVRKQGPMGGT